jgi:plastocyanin
MKSSPSALLLVVGLLGALGAAYLLSWRLAPARPAPRFAGGAVQGPEQAGAAGGAGDSGAKAGAAPTAKPRKPGAYEVIEVKDGGTIRVFCKLSRAVEAQTIPFNKDQAGCGHPNMPNERCVFDPATLGLANCIVGLTDVAKGKDFEGAMAEKGALVTLDHKQCRYVPHVILMRAGQQLHLWNSDPVQHNVHGYFKSITQFNEMISSNSKLEPTDGTRLTLPGLYPIKCDIHYWMTGYAYAARHPYHAVSGADGTCALTNVPAGQYRIGCWHEGMRIRVQQNGAEISGYEFSADITLPEQVVDVPAGGTVDVTFVFDPK